jgi:hypothetical protein
MIKQIKGVHIIPVLVSMPMPVVFIIMPIYIGIYLLVLIIFLLLLNVLITIHWNTLRHISYVHTSIFNSVSDELQLRCYKCR